MKPSTFDEKVAAYGGDYMAAVIDANAAAAVARAVIQKAFPFNSRWLLDGVEVQVKGEALSGVLGDLHLMPVVYPNWLRTAHATQLTPLKAASDGSHI